MTVGNGSFSPLDCFNMASDNEVIDILVQGTNNDTEHVLSSSGDRFATEMMGFLVGLPQTLPGLQLTSVLITSLVIRLK